MARHSLWLAAAATLLALLASPGKAAPTVRRLTDQTFDSAVAAPGDLLVMFFAPWCAHCKKMTPEFEKAANQLSTMDLKPVDPFSEDSPSSSSSSSGSGSSKKSLAAQLADEAFPDLVLAKMDAEKYPDIAKRYGVDGYPALRYFKEKEKRAMSGEKAGRTADEIVAWASAVAKAGSRIVQLKTAKAVETFVGNANKTQTVVAVGLFEDEEHAETFVSMAESFPYPVRFGYVTTLGEAALAPLGITSAEALATLKDVVEEEGEEGNAGEGGAGSVKVAPGGGGGGGGEEDAGEGAGEGAGESAGLSIEAAYNTVHLFKPYDEFKVATRVSKPLEGSKKTKLDMADMMHKMMGVPHEEALKLIPEPKESKALTKWITKQMLPLVVPFVDGYMDLIFEGPVKAHLLVIVDPASLAVDGSGKPLSDPEEQTTAAAAAAAGGVSEEVLAEAALATRGEVLHIIMPAVNSTADIRRFFGLDDDTTDLPTAVFSDMRSATQETPQGEQFLFGQTSYGFGGGGLTVENLQRFAREGLDGELGGGGGGGGKKKKKKAKKGVKTSSAKGKKLASEL